MPTLQEILDQDLGLGESQPAEKVASDKTETDEIEKLAREHGLIEDHSASAGSQQKEASMSLEALYLSMHPEDATIVKEASQEKVSAQTKEAEEIKVAQGEFAYDEFARLTDAHLAKMAEELAGGATISGEAGDAQPKQTMANNKPGDAEKAINTDGKPAGDLKPENGPEVVGAEKAQAHGNGELKTAALRKHLLMAGIR